jgi:hypothetical protein
VRDPNSGVIAAHGQYILVRRAAYQSVGGHAAVADQILEDVALARAFRTAGYSVYFRYGADAVRTRMYRNWNELRDGWTKNLALLFPRPAWLAAWLVCGWAFSGTTLLLGVGSMATGNWRTAYYVAPALFLYLRIARANFRTGANLLAFVFGAPLFAYLLLRSRHAHRSGGVSWKGRRYSSGTLASASQGMSRPAGTGSKVALPFRQ